MENSVRRICFLNHCLANGGTDTFVINAAKGLCKRGYDVTVVMAVDDNGKKHFHEQEALDAGIHVLRTCDLDGIKKKIWHCKKLYKILKEGEYDVFHGNMDLFNGLNMLVAWFAKVPVRVCHSHNSMSQYEMSTGKHMLVGMYRFVMRRLCWIFSNRRCGCSELAMDYLFQRRWENDENSRVIYNGIILENYRNMNESEINKKKKELGVPLDKKIISVVGRIAQQKNPLFIVDMAASLLVRRSDWELVWAGTGEMQAQVEKNCFKAHVNEKIHMLGSRKDVNEILQCSDIYLMPSVFEGLPFALIEAQAAGLPCLISDTISDMVKCGACVSMSLQKSEDEWAETLSDMLDGKTLVKLDEEKIRKFDVENMVDQLEEVYQ